MPKSWVARLCDPKLKSPAPVGLASSKIPRGIHWHFTQAPILNSTNKLSHAAPPVKFRGRSFLWETKLWKKQEPIHSMKLINTLLNRATDGFGNYCKSRLAQTMKTMRCSTL